MNETKLHEIVWGELKRYQKQYPDIDYGLWYNLGAMTWNVHFGSKALGDHKATLTAEQILQGGFHAVLMQAIEINECDIDPRWEFMP